MERFVKYNNDTYDREQKLVWKDCTSFYGTIEELENELNIHKNWRLPSQTEVVSLSKKSYKISCGDVCETWFPQIFKINNPIAVWTTIDSKWYKYGVVGFNGGAAVKLDPGKELQDPKNKNLIILVRGESGKNDILDKCKQRSQNF